MYSLIAKTLSQTMHTYMTHRTEVVAMLCYFCLFGQKLVAMATSSLDWTTRKTPAISNHILAVSRRNGFIWIYSNFSPKIGCHGNAPLSLVYGSVTDELFDSTNPISKPNSAWMRCIQLKSWPFL